MLAVSHKQALTHVNETQAMFDKFSRDHRQEKRVMKDMSIELMSAPLKDEERARLENLRKELDDERLKFTEATIKLGKEKTALEVRVITHL